LQKILSIIESMAHEKNLPVESAMEAFKEALINTAKRLEGEEHEFEVEIDYDQQTYHLYKVLTVVPDDDERAEEEPDRYLTVEEAKEYDEEIEPGDKIRSEIHLEDYGRTAAANLFQELEYHIQRRIEQEIFEKYKAKVGSIIIGTVSRVDDGGNTYVEIGELKGILSQRNRIKGESFKTGDTLKALLRFVSIDPIYGMHLELTRTAP
jgi:N utilization substance protein A